MSRKNSLLALLFLLPLFGCNADDGLPKTVPAKGTVSVDDKPIEGAVVVLMQDSGTYFARGITDKSGNFSLDAFETKKGAVPGEYKVTVSKTVTVENKTKMSKALEQEALEAAGGDASLINTGWVNDLPNKYANPGTSKLSVTIPEDGKTDIRIELSRK
jgi:hypothetical protein